MRGVDINLSRRMTLENPAINSISVTLKRAGEPGIGESLVRGRVRRRSRQEERINEQAEAPRGPAERRAGLL